MANEKKNLRKELRAYKFKFDLLQKIPCDKEENKKYQKLVENGEELPKDVYCYVFDDGTPSTTEFYTVYEADLTEAEIAEYLAYKQLDLIRTIKNCAVFFTVLAIIGLVGYFLLALMAM